MRALRGDPEFDAMRRAATHGACPLCLRKPCECLEPEPGTPYQADLAPATEGDPD